MYTIVFDLDGTLIDTAPDLIHTLNLILTQEGLPALPYGAARNLIGGGAQVMIQRALTAEGKDATEAEIERLYAAFIAYYSEHIAVPRAGPGSRRYRRRGL
jgi:phosphoglycolate phosphatase